MNNDDILKLEAVEDYTLLELKIIITFLEGGMFCDRFGQAYTREHIKKIAGKGYSTPKSNRDSNDFFCAPGFGSDRPKVDYSTRVE